MAHTQHTPQEVARIGREIYEAKIRPEVEETARGHIVVIDIETGDYEIDRDHLVAAKRAHARHPGGEFFAVRVGQPVFARLGGAGLGNAR